jgi:type II secretory pathway predicted ATPase ExeA
MVLLAAAENDHQQRSRLPKLRQRGPGRLTDSAARTDVVLRIRRTVRPKRVRVRVLGRLRPCWKIVLSGL